MEDIYEVKVSEKIYDKILSGKCTYYIFVNDRKRLSYKEGNILTLKNENNTLKVEIVNMLYFTTVKELLDMVGKEKCGFTSSQNVDIIEDYYYNNYNAADIDKFGLVAVQFKVK